MIQASASSIPQNILDKAKAVAVFPGVVKVAFGLGGEGGKGIISRRVNGGWSIPAYFRLARQRRLSDRSLRDRRDHALHDMRHFKKLPSGILIITVVSMTIVCTSSPK